MMFTRLILSIAIVAAPPTGSLLAHEGEDHGNATTSAALVPGTVESVFTLSAVTENFEVVLKYPPAVPGKELKLVLYLSDYATNRPIKDAEIALELKGLESLTPRVSMTDLAGVYHAEFTLPDTASHDVLLTITAGDVVDLIPLSSIQAGKALPVNESAEHSEKEGLGLLIRLLLILGMLLLLAGFGYAVYRFGKRRTAEQPHRTSQEPIASSEKILRRSA